MQQYHTYQESRDGIGAGGGGLDGVRGDDGIATGLDVDQPTAAAAHHLSTYIKKSKTAQNPKSILNTINS